MASALKTVAGAATASSARNAWRRAWASGWFSQSVPMRFHRNGTASSRRTSTPWLASRPITASISANTTGLP